MRLYQKLGLYIYFLLRIYGHATAQTVTDPSILDANYDAKKRSQIQTNPIKNANNRNSKTSTKKSCSLLGAVKKLSNHLNSIIMYILYTMPKSMRANGAYSLLSRIVRRQFWSILYSRFFTNHLSIFAIKILNPPNTVKENSKHFWCFIMLFILLSFFQSNLLYAQNISTPDQKTLLARKNNSFDKSTYYRKKNTQTVTTATLSTLNNEEFTLTPVDPINNTLETIIQSLVGSGVKISNIQTNLPQTSDIYGSFSNGDSILGMKKGLILTTGSIENAKGPNSSSGTGRNNGMPGYDLLNQIINPGYDAGWISFDVTPFADTLSFKYLFASDEYNEYVGSKYNDVFALFIKGPNINGSKNIALIPGSNIPVSINTVNNEANSQYFISNEYSDPVQYNIEYDGLTVPLKATIQVIPNSTYTLTFAIQDISDGIYDSGVFIEAGSLKSRMEQMISFSPIPDQTFGNSPFVLSATATSGLPVSLNVSGPAILNGTTLTITGTGEVTITASQQGNSNYIPALSVKQSFVVHKANQNIIFNTIPDKTFGDVPFQLSATASSGLPVTFSIISGLATIFGNTLTITGAGKVIVKATQKGNINYNEAAPVDQTFNINKADQTITFTIPDQVFGEPPFIINSSTNSGLPISFDVVSGPVSTSDNTITLTGIGTATVRATQTGNSNFNPATPKEQLFKIYSNNKEWDKTIGGNDLELLTSLQQTNDGGYILGGTSHSGISGDKTGVSRDIGNLYNGTGDYWIVKLNADGSKAWDKTIGGNKTDKLTSLQQTSDGGYILGGSSWSGISGDKTQASSDYDYWIVKLNADGTKVWDKTIVASYDDELTSLQQTSDGGYILGGNSHSFKIGDKSENNKGSDDYWVVKLDAAGTKEWDKTIGGSYIDKLTSVQQTSDGGYILGGTSLSGKSADKTETNRGNIGVGDYWIVKLDAAGTKEWDKTIGGSEGEQLASVQQTSDGGYILGGSSYSGKSGDKSQVLKGSTTYWVVKLKADGTKTWDKSFGSIGSNNLTSLQQTSDGGYILGGSSSSGKSEDKTQVSRGLYDYWIVKLKADGIKVWDKSFGGSNNDNLSSLQQTSDGGYILGGYSYSNISGDKTQANRGDCELYCTFDYWVVKLNSDAGISENRLNQTITLQSIPNKTFGEAPSTLSATASSGLPVTFGIVSGPAAIIGNTLTLTGVGTVRVKVSQAGNTTYNAAPEEMQTFSVAPPAPLAKDWDRTIGGSGDDRLYKVAATSDGDYILGGYSYSTKNNDKSEPNRGATTTADYWVVRLKADGSKAWDKSFGGTLSDVLTSLQQTNDGGYILGGYSYSTNNNDKSEPNRGATTTADYWVVKLDATGNKVWDKRFGGTSNDLLYSLQQTSDGGYILGGYSASGATGDKSEPGRGSNDYWVVKIDADGTKIWDKRFGGAHSDVLTSLQQTSDGGYVLGGYSYSLVAGDKTALNRGTSTYADYWVIKIDATGTKVWDKTFGGTSNDMLNSLQQTSDGGYILGGYSTSGFTGNKGQLNKGSNDYWVVKIDANGTKVWDKSFGGTLSDVLTRLQQTNDGGYMVGGYSYSANNNDKSEPNRGAATTADYWMVKLTADGTKVLDKSFGGSGDDQLQYLQQTSDKGYILGGYSNSSKIGDKSELSRGTYDYWVVKLGDNTSNVNQTIAFDPVPKIFGSAPFTLSATASSGLPVTLTIVSGPAIISGNTVTLTGVGRVTVKATQAGNATYNATEVTKTFEVTQHVPLAKDWDKTIGGSLDDRLYKVAATSDGGYILGGYSTSGNTGDKSQAGKGGNDYWVVRLKADGSKVWDKSFGGTGHDYLRTIQQTSDGGYILGGYSYSINNNDKTEPNRGATTTADYWVVKLDATGTRVWDKTIGGTSNDLLTSLQQTSDGGYVLGGYSASGATGDKSEPGRGSNDYWVVKLDATGSKIWDKRFGGAHSDVLNSLQQTSDGGYILGGYSHSLVAGDKTDSNRGTSTYADYWVVKLDATGSKVWDKTFGGTSNDVLNSLQQTSDGGYILGGYSTSGLTGNKGQLNKGSNDYWVVKIDANGNKVWDKSFGGTLSDVLTTLQQTSDGGYMLGGSSNSTKIHDKSEVSKGGNDYWVVKLTAEGIKVWDKTIGSNLDDQLQYLQQTSDKGYILGGFSNSGINSDKSEASKGSYDYWVVKIMGELPPSNTQTTTVAQVNSPQPVAEQTILKPIAKEETVRQEVRLGAYPNPFTAKVTASFTLPQAQPVSVKVYDSQGNEVATLFQGEAKANQAYEVQWQPKSHQPTGMYIIRLQTSRSAQAQRIILTK